MLQASLQKALLFIIALNTAAAGILFIFLVNYRITIKRRAAEREFALLLLMTIKKSTTTEQVAKELGLKVEDVARYCHAHGLETPEEAADRTALVARRKEEEERRIAEEEAIWRAEQERINTERIREKELEAKKRRERLKKFGIV